MSVVYRVQAPAQTKESARRDKRPPLGYCMAICFYYVALGHMFLLVGCGRGARPYVSIGWLWAWGCFKEFFFTFLDIIMRGNYPLNSSQTPWAHLFVLIICEIITHIRSTQHSNLIFYTM